MQSTKWVHKPLWISKVKVISLETARLIEAKFPVDPPWDEGMKEYKCFMIKMADMPISCPRKTLGRLKPNFIWSLHGKLGWKFVQMFWVTWPRWLPGMVKTLKNLLFWNQEANDIETWYTALGTQVLPNLFKWWHWIDLDHFYNMVKFVS